MALSTFMNFQIHYGSPRFPIISIIAAKSEENIGLRLLIILLIPPRLRQYQIRKHFVLFICNIDLKNISSNYSKFSLKFKFY